MQPNISEMLLTGRRNAIPCRQLETMTGLSNRQLRKQIACERRAGALILSTTENGGGYFLPEDGDAVELRRFIASMTSRGRETFAVLKAARQALRELENASAAEGGGEDDK